MLENISHVWGSNLFYVSNGSETYYEQHFDLKILMAVLLCVCRHLYYEKILRYYKLLCHSFEDKKLFRAE